MEPVIRRPAFAVAVRRAADAYCWTVGVLVGAFLGATAAIVPLLCLDRATQFASNGIVPETVILLSVLAGAIVAIRIIRRALSPAETREVAVAPRWRHVVARSVAGYVLLTGAVGWAGWLESVVRAEGLIGEAGLLASIAAGPLAGFTAALPRRAKRGAAEPGR